MRRSRPTGCQDLQELFDTDLGVAACLQLCDQGRLTPAFLASASCVSARCLRWEAMRPSHFFQISHMYIIVYRAAKRQAVCIL